MVDLELEDIGQVRRAGLGAHPVAIAVQGHVIEVPGAVVHAHTGRLDPHRSSGCIENDDRLMPLKAMDVLVDGVGPEDQEVLA